MDARQHLEAAVEKNGGIASAARKWGIPYQSLRGVVSGWRGVGRRTAATWAAKSNGELDASLLIWIRATRKESDAA